MDADVATIMAVAAIKAAVVIKDVAVTDTTDKTVRAKVRTIKGTKVPTTKATRALVTKAVGAGPTTSHALHWYSLSLKTLRASTTRLYPAP